MTGMFCHCLASPPTVSASTRLDQNIGPEALEFDQEDVTLKNLKGEDAIEAAERWAESRKMVRTLEMLRGYLMGRERVLVDLVLRREAGTAEAPNARNRSGSRGRVRV